ncbi:MAG: apolipoprotein N-acyltransferase [Syntrophorhabdaceae bacterium]|nr:apolipoprotein N-acyltransferase [Syntrophorhabdaceae bacterium]
MNASNCAFGRRSMLSGILFALAYAAGMPGYDVPALQFVCMVPFLDMSVRGSSVRAAAREGWLIGTLASLPLYYWISHTIAVEGKLGWPVGALAAILLSAYLGAYISVAAAGARGLHDRFGDAGLWFFPFFWTGLELARTYLFFGFPWMFLGYTLSNSELLCQAADLGGVYGLSFLLALCGTSLYLAGKSWSERALIRVTLCRAAPAVAAVLFLVFYGMIAIRQESPAAGELRVGIAQGGVDQSEKWDSSNQREILEIYEELTRRTSDAEAKLIVWPETAAPFFYGWKEELTREVDRIGREAGVPLIFGAPWFEPDDGGKFYNSVFFLDSRGVPAGRYDKRRLVPFGEYIPLRRLFFFFQKLAEGSPEDFSTGKAPAIFPVEGAMVSPSICYEAVFPMLIRDTVLEGATVLVNLTNDAWFGDTVAPNQHLAMVRLRSVEMRRPMVRAANSGISAIIDSRGRIVASEGLFRKGVVVGNIQPGTERTLYAKTGNLFGISCIIICFFALLNSNARMLWRRDFLKRKQRL